MVKCIFCLRDGRKLDKCTNCKQSFHERCGNHKRKGEIFNCCSTLETKQLSSETKCHRCQIIFSENIALCSSIDCKEAFCSRCLKYRYKIDQIDLHPGWECFVCSKTCACKSCRRATNSKTKRYTEILLTEGHSCHQCNKKINSTKCTFCEKCKNYLCLSCSEKLYKTLENCPVCLDICTCTKCGDNRFNKDFPKFNKGVDLRALYPYDLENIFYVNGFWVRSINL